MKRLIWVILSIVCMALLVPAMLPSRQAAAPNAAAYFSPMDAVQTVGYGCSAAPSTPAADLLDQVTLDSWSDWIRALSGAQPVMVNGQNFTITTRHSPALFNGTSPAYAYVREQILQMGYPEAQLEDHSYPYGSQTWKNLILTVPGTQFPEQIVILSAHLDSINRDANDLLHAPGADDNATGAATLLEAARVLQGHPQPRTLRMIWFTGEEQGTWGSHEYVASHALTGLVGVINVDMIGYDGDGDRCYELHVGTLSASNFVGRCITQAAASYGIRLQTGYITAAATFSSDHAAFWSQGIGAVEVGENFNSPGGYNSCPGGDENPNYHRASDTFDHLTLSYGFDVARSALAGAFAYANSAAPMHTFLPFAMQQTP